MKKVFLYRIKDSEDRDCCAYIENDPMRLNVDIILVDQFCMEVVIAILIGQRMTKSKRF